MIIFNESLNEHLKTPVVFQNSWSKFENKQNKCIFRQNKLSLNADPDKTDSLRHAEPPQNVNELRSFLGLCTYFSIFIPNYSDGTV